MKVDPRKVVARKVVDTTSSSLNPFDETFNNGNMIQYVSVGVAAIAMGICIFLYKEVKKVKTDVIDISDEIKKLQNNEQLEENTKTIQSLEEKVNQIGSLIQHMAIRQQQTPPVNRPSQVVIPTKTVVKEEVVNNLPTPMGQEVKIIEGGPDDSVCNEDEGICEVPEVNDNNKKKKKILEI